MTVSFKHNKHTKLNKRAFLIFLGPTLVYFVSEILRGSFGRNGVIFDVPPIFSPEMYVEETQRRIFVFTMAVIFIVTTIAITYATLRDLRKRFGLQQVFILLLPVLLIFIGGVFVTSGSSAYIANSYEMFGVVNVNDKQVGFFEAVLGRITQSGHILNDPAIPGLNLFEQFEILFQKWTPIALTIGVWAVISGAISCLSIPDQKENESDNLQEAFERLEHYLLLSAILLASGIVFYMSWMSWPGFIVTGDEIQTKAYNGIVRGMTIFTGVTYSLMIASFYIPIRLIILGRLKALGKNQMHVAEGGDVTRKADPNVHPLLGKVQSLIGLKQSQKEFYAYLFKITSPVIVAWVSSFLAGITSTAI